MQQIHALFQCGDCKGSAVVSIPDIDGEGFSEDAIATFGFGSAPELGNEACFFCKAGPMKIVRKLTAKEMQQKRIEAVKCKQDCLFCKVK